MPDTTRKGISARLEADYLNPRPPIDPATFRAIAEYANQHQDDRERQRVIFAIVYLLTPLDLPNTSTWWHELRRALVRAEAARTVGAAWDEVGVDWDARATEAAQMLAAQR